MFRISMGKLTPEQEGPFYKALPTFGAWFIERRNCIYIYVDATMTEADKQNIRDTLDKLGIAY